MVSSHLACEKEVFHYIFVIMRYIAFLLFTCLLCAREAVLPSCREGNFSVPASQSQAPLIGFGQNIIDQGQMQLFLFGATHIGNNKHRIDVVPSFLYGITNDLSLFISAPVAVNQRNGSSHSSGVKDVSVQLEYAIIEKPQECAVDQLTIVANVSFPTGSKDKDPPTGAGGMGYFLGMTYDHMARLWYFFTSCGVRVFSSSLGNRYLYQFGLGRNMLATRGWIFNWLVEFDGTFSEHTKGRPNSGSNTIRLTPSLWASSSKWVVQFGVGFVVVEHRFGKQNRDKYFVALNIARTF